MIDYKTFSANLIEEVEEIYRAEGWHTYLQNHEKLARAFEKSLYILGAFDGENLVGFVRCVGDGEHILIVQDLIVKRKYRKMGIGTHLFKHVWDVFKHVRMFQVTTDISDETDNHFYRSFGMKPLADGEMIAYFRK
jgi:ribosomal protein S18 acetylase RimI-like enzyme